METVATLLGQSDITCSARYVDVNPVILCDMFSNAIYVGMMVLIEFYLMRVTYGSSIAKNDFS